ncbi:MAG: hypothetical protein Q9228_007300 [Teloschistes exilis]
MKLSYFSVALILFGAAVAAPNKLEQRQVSNAPIHLIHGPNASDDIKCGGETYKGSQVFQSAQYGINLHLAGQTRGKAKYPHPFNNDDSKGNKLNFPSYCPADTNRMEYPLQKTTYDGGKSNTNTGQERVVYYWNGSDEGVDGHPSVQYCGVMTHTGAPTGGFLLC